MSGKTNINGINPVLAVILTLVVIGLSVWAFAPGHPVWGTIAGLIGLDFLADAVLSFRKA